MAAATPPRRVTAPTADGRGAHEQQGHDRHGHAGHDHAHGRHGHGRHRLNPAAELRGLRRRRWRGWAIAFAVLLGLVGLRLLTADAGELPRILQDFVTLTVSVIVESFPFVVLGILLAILVQVWVPESWLLRVLPQNGFLRRAVLSLLGFFLPVCECGNVPLSRGLMLRGLTTSDSITFLLAAPILNPVTILTTHQAFGGDDGILMARLLGGFAIANILGWVFSRHPEQQKLLTGRFREECRVHAGQASPKSLRGRSLRSLEGFSHELSEMMPALVFGSMVAGFIQVVVPRDVLVALGSNPVLSVLALMLLAFVISICANVDAFFVLSFGSTFLPGAIIAFLVFGPMIDIKMLALMRTTYRARTLVVMTLLVALLSALLGLAVNWFG